MIGSERLLGLLHCCLAVRKLIAMPYHRTKCGIVMMLAGLIVAAFSPAAIWRSGQWLRAAIAAIVIAVATVFSSLTRGERSGIAGGNFGPGSWTYRLAAEIEPGAPHRH
jgi:hypothetical protein